MKLLNVNRESILCFIHSETCNNDQRENEPLTEKHPPAVENGSMERSTCIASDHEDFYGFDENDLGTTIVNPVSGGNDIVTEEENIGNGDQSKNVVQLENGVTGSNPPDSKDIDDEIIFVENNVEVIEIDDDDDVDEVGHSNASRSNDNHEYFSS